MVGKFLLGMVSGGLLVTGGLVVASALFPMQAANDNPPAVVEEQIAAPAPAMTDAEAADPEPDVAPDVVPDVAEAAVEAQTAEEPVSTAAVPEDTAAEASTAADTTAEPAVTAEATPEEPADVVKAPTSEAVTEPTPELTPEPAPVEAAASDPAPEVSPAAQPEVDPSSTALEAPKAEVAEAAEPVAPTVAEVPPPETLSEPSKPAEAIADAAAETPAAPEETTVAEAEPEPALAALAPADTEATVDPAPAAEAEPVGVAEVEPAPAEAVAEPGSDTATTEATTTETVAEAAAEDPTPPAKVAAETVPDNAPAPAEEIVTAEANPASELPAPETPAAETPAAAAEAPAAETPAAETPAAEAPVVETMPAEPAPAEVAEAPAMVPAPETAEVAPAAENAMPGTRPDALPGNPVEADALPGTPVEAEEAGAEPDKKSPTFKPAPGLPRAGEGVIIDRDAEAEPASDDPAAVAVDTRPIVQFAAAFENSEAKPPLAIVLVDDGSADLDRAALAALPFPVSFALDPLDPASAQHAATYRAAGKEVVMLVTGIAEGAIPADVEVAFQSMEQGLPEAVAAMDLPDPSFQNRRPLAATVVPILKAQGRGLLTWDAGLNAADQVARREDLEAAVIFRDIGATGTDSAAIRRLLDRAVFKAGQDGRASVAGKADAATVAALLEWSVEGKAATVALAPVTAVLTVE